MFQPRQEARGSGRAAGHCGVAAQVTPATVARGALPCPAGDWSGWIRGPSRLGSGARALGVGPTGAWVGGCGSKE